MKKIILMLFLLLFAISIVNAEENYTIQKMKVTVQNNTIKIYGELVSGGFVGTFINSEDILSSNAIICENETTYENETIHFNCYLNINFEKEYNLTYKPIYSIESSELLDLAKCINDRARYINDFQACQGQREKLQNIETNFSNCQLNLNSCGNDKSNLQSDKEGLLTEQESSKNTKWAFGIGGLVLGVLSFMAYRGEIFGTKVKGARDYHNPEQAG